MVRLVYTFALVAALSLSGLFTSSASAGNGFGGSGGQFNGSGGQFGGKKNFKSNGNGFNGNGFNGNKFNHNSFNHNGFNGGFNHFHNHNHKPGFIFVPGKGFIFIGR